MPNDEGWEAIKDESCRPGAEWFGMYGIPQRIIPAYMRPNPKAWASSFVQTLEETSNTSKFIVKRVFGLMDILHHETINIGHLTS